MNRVALLVVLGLYLVLGVNYALRTPLWQVPDEPAHYNYVAQLAFDPFDLPRIEPGDYPFEVLEHLKALRFPADEPIRGIEYEDHQPPAYYALAAPIYRLAGQEVARQVHALRLLGVLLGMVTVWLAWCCARVVDPDDEVLAVASAAFVAFLPMNLTMNAAVNNDPLAYALMAGILLVALRRATGRIGQRAFVWGGGVLLGLAFLTKVSIYSAGVLLVAAEILAWWRRGRFGSRAAVATVAQVLAIGLVFGLPWFIRNERVYGAGDWLGKRAHDAAVVGQPRTAAWIHAYGLTNLLGRMALFTFESFWGVFGWMGVFLDPRIYAVLALATIAAAAGLAGYLWRLGRTREAAAGDERAAVLLLAMAIVLSVAGFGWWNLTFVQHQGRYLFTALVPIALCFMLGLRELAWRGGKLVGLGGRAGELEWLVLYGFSAALAGLAWLSLTRYIVPGLR